MLGENSQFFGGFGSYREQVQFNLKNQIIDGGDLGVVLGNERVSQSKNPAEKADYYNRLMSLTSQMLTLGYSARSLQ